MSVSEMKLHPGMFIVIDSDCYLQQQNEYTGHFFYDYKSEVRRKNYLKYCEYMGARGGVVVEALRYKLEGCGINS
jgi:hypothetical protein